jgi:ComF family protein
MFLNAMRPRLRSQCEVCRQWDTTLLCHDCVQRFTPPVPRCARCGLRLGLAAPACGECLKKPPPFTRTVCVADYGFPWDGLITQYKFRARPELAAVLAAQLSLAVSQAGELAPSWVIPVPLSSQRLAERGYNQAWELARRLELPALPDLLWRVLDTAHQANLDRTARQRNLRAAFMVNPAQRSTVQGQHLALVDDVMTSGATLREAAAVLLQAGAARVDAWVLARTPEQH